MTEQPDLAEAQAKAMEALQEIQDALALQAWSLDEPIEGTVLRFRKKSIWYVAARRPADEKPWGQEDMHWVVTIPEPPGYSILSWPMVKSYIGGSPVEVCTHWRRLPTT